MFTFILAILTLNAQAADLKLPSAGKYQFKNEFTVISKKRYETVYGFTEAGRIRLQELLTAGNTCKNVGRQIFLCSIFETETGTEDEVREMVLKKMSETNNIEFSPLHGEVSLISKGDALEEWMIPQTATFAGKTHENFRYIIGQGFEKIFLGMQAEQTFVIQENGQLAYPISVAKTESQTVYYSYWVLSFFRM